MAYTALEKMRKKNKEEYGIDLPAPVPILHRMTNISELERSCQKFLYEDCEDLRFDATKTDLNDSEGTSMSLGQIPLNMERDIDRLCLQNAIHRFMASGSEKDAFDVYFCYIDMYLGSSGGPRRLLELLAECESNSGALLMKHRDHYVHSVYVFLLGLAVYCENKVIRGAFNARYAPEDSHSAARLFLKYWGLAALFHDMGYPLELPFEQVKTYFSGSNDGPYVNYMGMSALLKLGEEDAALAGTNDIVRILSENITDNFFEHYGTGTSPEEFEAVIRAKLSALPQPPGDFMDHAYFSAVQLFKQILPVWKKEAVSRISLDTISAVALHNSFFRFEITNVRKPEKRIPLEVEDHPIAYLLMLCDELQCWDRVSYGQNSRNELHPMGCSFSFTEGGISAVYAFDAAFEKVKNSKKGTYKNLTSVPEDETVSKFLADIEHLLVINRPGALQLYAGAEFTEPTHRGNRYISRSSYLHLYNFAASLHARYMENAESLSDLGVDRAFDRLSLEYKLSNVMQAKAFAGYLDQVGCFYTDRLVDYAQLEQFTEEQMNIIGPLEHDRWNEEKHSMGWSAGSDYEDLADKKTVRERCRQHKLIDTEYDALPKEEQDKDTEPMNRMLRLIARYDGLRVYQY